MLRFACLALALLCLLPVLALSDPPAPPWYPDEPLYLVEFDVTPGSHNSYLFTGRVANNDPYGVTWIEITGVYQATVGVYPDGTFIHSTMTTATGGVAARAYDTYGRWSNEATDEIF